MANSLGEAVASSSRVSSPPATSQFSQPYRPQQKCPDIDLEGITELWTPEGDDIVADLCFVHGLKGHPKRTWLYQDSKKSSKLKILKSRKKSEADHADTCYWPFELVPQDFPKLRIMVYGYDSHPTHFYTGKTNQMTISQHARNLLEQVTNTRGACRGRPLIFVAHSLGGILVKDAIVESLKYEYQPNMRDLGLSCSAIFFFGTPHSGASIAEYGLIVSNVVGLLGFSVYKEVLRDLKPDGEKLSSVNREFFDLLNKNIPANEKLQIYSFQEGKPLSSVKVFDGKIVPDASSFFNRRDVERNSFVSENHMDMCRFRDARVQPYRDFKAALADYLKNTKANKLTEEVKQRLEAERRAWIENLDFKDRLVRKQHLDNLQTTEASFEWIWNSPFSEWLKDGTSPLFWISGKPASGKSTLINYIAASNKTLKLLKEAHNVDVEWKLIYFFFDFRAGEGIGNNFEGFLRSLLVQLLKHIQDPRHILKDIAKIDDVRDPRNIVQLSISQLRSALQAAINAVSASVFILLDGLDEYEGKKVELSNFIHAISSNAVKICVASRPDPPFPDAFETVPTFRMQDLNTPGIRAFALYTMQNFFSKSTRVDSLTLNKLIEDVSENSKGVFLWTRFAIFEIIDGLTSGEAPGSAALQRRLDQLPQELEEIYARIFAKSPSSSKKFAGLILLLVSDAAEPSPRLALIREAASIASQPASPVPLFLRIDSFEEEDTNESFRRKILAATGGTVEAVEAEKDPDPEDPLDNNIVDTTRLRLTHRSVKTYLDSKGWNTILGDRYYPSLGHETWLHLSRLKWISTPLTTPNEAVFNRIFQVTSTSYIRKDTFVVEFWISLSTQPLLAYILSYLSNHAGSYESISKTSSLKFLRLILSSNYSLFHLLFIVSAGRYCACKFISPFRESQRTLDTRTFVIQHTLVLSTAEYLAHQTTKSNTRMGSFSKLVPRFLKNQKKANEFKMSLSNTALQSSRYIDSDTSPQLIILKEVLEHCNVEDLDLGLALSEFGVPVIKMVLEYRVAGELAMKLPSGFPRTLDGPNVLRRPLWVVAQRVHMGYEPFFSVIEMLVKRGEDINGMCGPDGAFLHSYVIGLPKSFSYFKECVEFVLSKGADINQEGPKGTPLASLWRTANSEESAFTFVGREACLEAILHFISLGAVNNRPDANGVVPSVEKMSRYASGLNTSRSGTSTESEDEQQNENEAASLRSASSDERDDEDYHDAANMPDKQ